MSSTCDDFDPMEIAKAAEGDQDAKKKVALYLAPMIWFS